MVQPQTNPRGFAPSVSIASAILDEAAVLPEFLQRCCAVLDSLPGSGHELVLVDDGSMDGSDEILSEAANRDERIQVLVLSRNFGHQRALRCALEHSTGDVVVLLDSDLQDPPEEIPRMLEEWQAGYDVVYARRTARKESFLLRSAYFVFYRLIALQSTVKLPLDAGDFSLMSRQVVNAIESAPERHRYLRGLRAWVGFRQKGIDVERAARSTGQSKYTALRLLALAGDGLFAFSTFPLRAATTLGCVALLLSSAFGAYSVLAKIFFDQSPRGFTALILAIVFLSGTQLLFLGVIGEYLGRVYDEVKARPPYLIAQRFGSRSKET